MHLTFLLHLHSRNETWFSAHALLYSVFVILRIGLQGIVKILFALIPLKKVLLSESSGIYKQDNEILDFFTKNINFSTIMRDIFIKKNRVCLKNETQRLVDINISIIQCIRTFQGLHDPLLVHKIQDKFTLRKNMV